LLKKKTKQIKTHYLLFFLLTIKYYIVLNIHIYELLKQTLVDTPRKLTNCRESDSTTNHREAWAAPIFVNILNIKNGPAYVNNKLSLRSVWIHHVYLQLFCLKYKKKKKKKKKSYSMDKR
jgi:hypothetical protein